MTDPAPSLTRAQSRAVDRVASEELGVPGVVLMENAGLLATLALLEAYPRPAGPVEVLAGGGNNGGDGYVVARQLLLRGHRVRVWATHSAERLRGDAAIMRGIVDRSGPVVHPLEDAGQLDAARAAWREAGLFVDALLGTGFAGEVRAPLDAVLAAVGMARAARAVPLAALDVPSGLDADTGRPAEATLKADLTLTFVARKRGFDAQGAGAWTGRVRVLPIGAPAVALERVLSGRASG